ncbi:MAG: DUF6338 family protein [Deltaproteobacteria bacterium]|jgi:hypothetical protein|nr:DUF6338 family protein [Deltaproteobacteria bacterium]
MNLESLNIVLYTAIFLLPGFFIRNILTTLNLTRKLSDNATFLSCFMYSVINLAIWSWAYILATNLYNNQRIPYYGYFVLLVAISLIGGLILSFVIGAFVQKRFIGWLAKRLRLKAVDPVDSTWDWLFSQLGTYRVIITLKDNNQIYGWYGSYSFTSSDPNERDIYVEYIYRLDENGEYLDDPENQGILIAKDQVKHIEFWG